MSVWRECSACGSQWEEGERGRPFCTACGSRRIEKLLLGEAKGPNLRQIPRDERIDNLAWLAGAKAFEPGEDGDEAWLGPELPRLQKTLAAEEIFLSNSEQERAAAEFKKGWDWAAE